MSRSVLPLATAFLLALACASLLVLAHGQAPLHIYRIFFEGTWGTGYGIGQVLFKATPLMFTGLSVALAMQAGLLNVGAEGQVALGAFLMGAVGAYLPQSTPAVVALPLCLGAGFVGGAAAGGAAGVLKAWRGAHEVIVTIMLNFVILAKLSDWGKPLYEEGSVHTQHIISGAQLTRIGDVVGALRGSASSTALVLGLAMAVLVWWFLHRTGAGFRLRAVGLSQGAARTVGISVARQTVLAMALAGGLAGLVGSSAVLGYKHYYEEGFSGGVGFMGIAVALVGRNHPLGIVLAALLFGTLAQGGLAINALVAKEIVDVLQAVIILAVAAASAYSSRALRDVVAGAAAVVRTNSAESKS